MGAISTLRHMAYTVDRLGGYRAFALYDVGFYREFVLRSLRTSCCPWAGVRIV